MKLKTVFAASLLVGSVAFADSTEVTAEHVLGVMPLTVGEETIISIPWVESGTTGDSQTIAVTNIIKTANLAVGDCLLWYNNAGGYQAWTVQSGSPNYWAPTQVAPMGRVYSSEGTENQVLSRGGALILHRFKSGETPIADTTIYIVGQYSAENGSSTIAAGTVDEPVFNLLASPAVSGEVDLSIKLSALTLTLGDQVVFENTNGDTVNYTWGTIESTGTAGWGHSVWNDQSEDIEFVAATANSMKISAGKGFWFKSCWNAARTISW